MNPMRLKKNSSQFLKNKNKINAKRKIVREGMKGPHSGDDAIFNSIQIKDKDIDTFCLIET